MGVRGPAGSDYRLRRAAVSVGPAFRLAPGSATRRIEVTGELADPQIY